MIKVTIGLPFYNAEQYLDFAILSVINQTFKDWELLLINDGSTDKSLSIAENYAKNDSRIQVFSDGLNKGLVERLNQSVSSSSGIYYARMDADDIMDIHRIEKQVEFLNKHTDIDVVGSSAMIINDKNEIVSSCSMGGISTSFMHPTIMGRLEWFKKNPYDSRFVRAEDTELWIRTSSDSSFFNIDQPLFFYREFGVPTLRKYLKSQEGCRKIYRNYKAYGKSICWSLRSCLLSYLKSFVYVIFSALALQSILIKWRRRKPLDKGLMLSNRNLLVSVKNV